MGIHVSRTKPSTHTEAHTYKNRLCASVMGVCASIPSVSSLDDGQVSSALSVSLWTLCLKVKENCLSPFTTERNAK